MKSPQREKARKDQVTVKAITDVASEISKRVDLLRKPEVAFPVRSLGNVRYSAVGLPRMPILSRVRLVEKPGALESTRNTEMPCAPRSGSVFA